MSRKGFLIVLSGPSGVGKNSVLNRLLTIAPVRYSISATTRAPRPGEVDGRDYFFYSHAHFEELAGTGQLLEWARVYDDYYGTPLKFIIDTLQSGQDLVLDLDVQGAAMVRQALPDAVLVFLFPPSLGELRKRLEQRGTESKSDRLKRLEYVTREMSCIRDYDYVVINDEVEQAAQQIREIWNSERCRVRRTDVEKMVEDFFRNSGT